jgi:hypothetical protein
VETQKKKMIRQVTSKYVVNPKMKIKELKFMGDGIAGRVLKTKQGY